MQDLFVFNVYVQFDKADIVAPIQLTMQSWLPSSARTNRSPIPIFYLLVRVFTRAPRRIQMRILRIPPPRPLSTTSSMTKVTVYFI